MNISSESITRAVRLIGHITQISYIFCAAKIVNYYVIAKFKFPIKN